MTATGPEYKVIAGLGNPGRKYAGTRHNLGFAVIGRLAEKTGIACTRKSFGALVGEGTISGVRTLLVLPQQFMNCSGPAIRDNLGYFRRGLSDLLIVCDDFALPAGMLRFRTEGSDGGHNGLGSVIEALGTRKFSRLRIGVGPLPPGVDSADYVLARPGPEQTKALDGAVPQAVEAATLWVTDGTLKCMNRYNRRAGEGEAAKDGEDPAPEA